MTKKVYNQDELQQVVTRCISYREVLTQMGKVPRGANYQTLKKYLQEYQISTEHFIHRARKHSRTQPMENYLKKGRSWQSSRMKPRLYREKLLIPECCLCGQGETWRGQKMSLILDHIDGDHTNNELANLRVVCPNCNATLDTHCGKNIPKRRQAKEQETTPTTIEILPATLPDDLPRRVIRPSLIRWPDRAELAELVWKFPRSTLATMLGVSDVAIAKHCRKEAIPQPCRGYWARQAAQLNSKE